MVEIHFTGKERDTESGCGRKFSHTLVPINRLLGSWAALATNAFPDTETWIEGRGVDHVDDIKPSNRDWIRLRAFF
jgi:hypothetical protein